MKELVLRTAHGVHVTASCELASQPGEYPRMATVAMNAYTGPILSRYIERLEARVAKAGLERGVLFGQCSGAVLTGAAAKAARPFEAGKALPCDPQAEVLHAVADQIDHVRSGGQSMFRCRHWPSCSRASTRTTSCARRAWR